MTLEYAEGGWVVRHTGERPFGGPDKWQAELQNAHPGWHIWYVPSAVGGHVSWHAQRLPKLTAPNALALAEAIVAAEGWEGVNLVDTLAGVVPTNGPDRLHVLDRLRAELSAAFPNWSPVYTPVRDGSVIWRAQRVPILHAYSADDIARDIELAEREAAG